MKRFEILAGIENQTQIQTLATNKRDDCYV